MIAADRERLSQLLADIYSAEAGELQPINRQRLRDARAIVAGCSERGIGDHDCIEHETRTVTFDPPKLDNQPPNTTLDAFLTHPIHEYRDHITTRHRHRAPNPWWLAVALTIAGILAIALTATPTTSPGPSHQPDPNSPTRANLAPTRDTHGYTYPPRTP